MVRLRKIPPPPDKGKRLHVKTNAKGQWNGKKLREELAKSFVETLPAILRVTSPLLFTRISIFYK